MAYNILLIQWCNAFSDPDAPAAHLVGKHHIRHQAIADDGYLAWMRHTSFWMLLEMGHDFLVASWLLDAMREDEHASFFLQLGGKTTVSVIAGSTGRVRYNQKPVSGIFLLELPKAFLDTSQQIPGEWIKIYRTN